MRNPWKEEAGVQRSKQVPRRDEASDLDIYVGLADIRERFRV